MSTNQPFRERDRGGDREVNNYRSGYNNNRGGGGGFRGRGGPGGYKPRRYWDNDDYYKDERDHGRGRRRRSYSRSRSRSRSYSSRSRSRSRSPSRRGRSPLRKDVSQRAPEQPIHSMPEVHEPYVPSSEPSNAWSSSRMQQQLPQEYMSHTNGQAAHVAHAQMNPYGNLETTAYPPPSHYHQEGPPPGMGNIHGSAPPPMGYGYSNPVMPENQYHPPPSISTIYHPHPGISQATAAVPPPPAITEAKLGKDDGVSESSKKKKDKRKKKKRHHSSSSSSSSSDDSSNSRKRRSKGKKGSSDSSSEEDKKTSSQTSTAAGLTTAQKDALLKQREGYQTKLEILEREIAKLQNKEDELVRSRADPKLVDENLKLQAELKGRCKAVLIVLEKIDDVLRVKRPAPVEKAPPVVHQEVPAPPSIAQPPTKLVLPTPSQNLKEGPRICAFNFYDNGQHWCRLCNVFPSTAEQMLAHFHSKEHHDQIQQLGIDEKPWHKRNMEGDHMPVPGAKKAPFRGMQFYSPVEGWYCRLCNNFMGDPHCAVEHLKSDDHNANYMNFLNEHPDWEDKWVMDRDKALSASGKLDPAPSARRSRFDDSRSVPAESIERKPIVPQDNMESGNGKSIRVQMRNSLKDEDRGSVSHFTAAPLHEVQVTKDSGLDEWMTKPKVTVDIIDTQKFAAIVRQKHGTKEKEVREVKGDVPDLKPNSAIAPTTSYKEKDYKKEKEDRRRTDKVELQISNRDNKDRDRYNNRDRERESRSSRRRSRSRSRSRSRDRRYNRRRSRSRSRSRSRDRSDRDRDRRDRGSERERPEYKETVKKLPMIGKMPLYKRPVISREKPEVDKSKTTSADASPLSKSVPPVAPKESAKAGAENVPMYNENTLSTAYGYDAHSGYDHAAGGPQEQYGMQPALYGQLQIDPTLEEPVTKDFPVAAAEMSDDIPGVEKETKDDAPAALPDDFQQALDIIYAPPSTNPKPGMVPQPVPPPAVGSNGLTDDAMVVASEYGDYSANGYASYMGYQPYQQSFDGYAPVGYDELDDGPPGVGNDNVGASRSTDIASQEDAEKDPPPPGDDDMDDLRMLGIDVEDTAVVVQKQ